MQTVNDAEYYFEPVTFRVENTLFRVPKEYLVQESTFFHDMFQLPRPPIDEAGQEGTTDTNPITLPVTAAMFRTIVRLLYSSTPGIPDPHLGAQEWMNVLDISRMWDMKAIREIAIGTLKQLLKTDPAQRWYLAKEYGIADWIKPAIEELIRRNDPVGERELEIFGQAIVLEIAKARESCLPIYNSARIIGWKISTERGQVPDPSAIAFEMPIDVIPRIQPCDIPLIDENRNQDSVLEKSVDFYFEDVVFQVEDCLYKVNNRPFIQHSPVLRNDFARRGFVQYTHDSPYVVNSRVTKGDFVNLLRLFFPAPKSDQNPWPESRTMEEWMSILRLSVLWRIQELQDLAKQNLTMSDFDTVHNQLRIAQECGIQEWYTSGMNTLVSRSDPLSGVECAVLSNKLMLEILSLRERVVHIQRNRHRFAGPLEQRGAIPLDIDISEPVDRVAAVPGSN